MLAFRLLLRKIVLVFWENDDQIYDCVLYSNINYSNKGQIKRAIYLFSQTKTCWDFQVAQTSGSQQASVAQWVLMLPSHMCPHSSLGRSMKRQALMPSDQLAVVLSVGSFPTECSLMQCSSKQESAVVKMALLFHWVRVTLAGTCLWSAGLK